MKSLRKIVEQSSPLPELSADHDTHCHKEAIEELGKGSGPYRRTPQRSEDMGRKIIRAEILV
jgi:hypothetical protein